MVRTVGGAVRPAISRPGKAGRRRSQGVASAGQGNGNKGPARIRKGQGARAAVVVAR
jgi:hypothetical protein